MDSVTISKFSVGGGFKHGEATVIIRDDHGGLVEDAEVTGEFTGDITTTDLMGTTDAMGAVVIDTSSYVPIKGKLSLTFCVTNVTVTDGSLLPFEGPPVCSSL